MSQPSNPEDRLLNLAEREMVAKTMPPEIDELSKDDLRALGKRLRQRSRR